VKKEVLYEITALLTVLLVVGIFTWFNINFPQCVYSGDVEITLKISIYIIAFILVISSLYLSIGRSHGKYYIFVVFLFSGLAILSTNYRSEMLERYHWSFEGVVSAKFKSKDHEAKTMTIDGVDYKLTPFKLWSNIDIGDFLLKESCSGIVIINKDEKIDIFD